MRFLTVDHGAWLTRIGLKARARMYTIGNPLIARTMLEHDIAAGLNVPVRLMIYEDASSRTTRLAYDLSFFPHARFYGMRKVSFGREKAGCQTHCSRRSRYRCRCVGGLIPLPTIKHQLTTSPLCESLLSALVRWVVTSVVDWLRRGAM